MKDKDIIQCGDLVRDELSGIEGIVAGVRVLLNGCVQFAVQPKDDSGKKMEDSFFIDWQTLKLVKKQVIARTLPPEKFLFMTDKPAVESGEKPGAGRGGPSLRMKAPRA